MNYEISKSNIKGKEDLKLIISPSDSLEREFFNALFAGQVIFDKITNSEEIHIKKAIDDPENSTFASVTK